MTLHVQDRSGVSVEPLSLAVFRFTSESIWLLDAHGRTLWANDRLSNLLGESAEQLRSRKFEDFSTDGAAAECFRSCVGENAEQRREMSFGTEAVGWADVRLIPFPAGDESSPSGVLAMITDVTRERQAEAAMRVSVRELERRVDPGFAAQTSEEEARGNRDRLLSLADQIVAANKELEAFSYSVSHDLREPLRSIDGFSRILLERYGSVLDDRGRDYLSRVRGAAQRMGLLIADMLTLARIARGELALERMNITRIARSICADLASSDPERRVEVAIADDLTAVGDPRLLEVVLANLLGNAWKFTSKCPEARINLTRCASDTDDVFLVDDNGAGFEMKYVEKLFRPFQRLHSDTEFGGTGVGLATVQRIIARHGGRVWAEATVGKGARVFFSIPRRSLGGKVSA